MIVNYICTYLVCFDKMSMHDPNSQTPPQAARSTATAHPHSQNTQFLYPEHPCKHTGADSERNLDALVVMLIGGLYQMYRTKNESNGKDMEDVK